jgi:hypothetical protein
MAKKQEKTQPAFKKDWGKTYEELVNDQLTKNSEFYIDNSKKNQEEACHGVDLKNLPDVMKKDIKPAEKEHLVPSPDGAKRYYTNWERDGAVDVVQNFNKHNNLPVSADIEKDLKKKLK